MKRKPTNKSDMYSLAMVIVEVCLPRGGAGYPGSDYLPLQLATGKMPFPDYTDHNVAIIISKGRRPSKPMRFEALGITAGVWKIAKQCWDEKEKERPEARAVLQSLENLFHSGRCTRNACSCLPWEVIDLGLE